MSVPLGTLKIPPGMPKGTKLLILGVPATADAVPVLVVCGVCGEDISRVAFGRVILGGSTGEVVVDVPLRCPECNALTVFIREESIVIDPSRLS